MPRSRFSSLSLLAVTTLLAAWCVSAAPCTTDGTTYAVSSAAIQSPSSTGASSSVDSTAAPPDASSSVDSTSTPYDASSSVDPTSTSTDGLSSADPTSTSTRAPQPTGTSTTLPGHGGMENVVTVAAGWYAAWMKGTYPPSSIAWSKYNMITFAFA
jgi:hypothetical protein